MEFPELLKPYVITQAHFSDLGTIKELVEFVDKYGLDILQDYIMFDSAIKEIIRLKSENKSQVG